MWISLGFACLLGGSATAAWDRIYLEMTPDQAVTLLLRGGSDVELKRAIVVLQTNCTTAIAALRELANQPGPMGDRARLVLARLREATGR